MRALIDGELKRLYLPLLNNLLLIGSERVGLIANIWVPAGIPSTSSGIQCTSMALVKLSGHKTKLKVMNIGMDAVGMRRQVLRQERDKRG